MDTATRIALRYTLLALLALLILQAIVMAVGYFAAGSIGRLNALTTPVAFAVAVGVMHGAVRAAYRAGATSTRSSASRANGA